MTLFDSATPACPAPTRRRFRLLNLLALIRSRRRLARLDEDALRDVGLSSRAARKEAKRPIWDVPDTWHD